MPAEVRIKIVDESGPAPLTGNGTGGGGGSGASPPPPPAPSDTGDDSVRRRRSAPKDDSDERRERRIRRGEAWRKRKRREAWAERINAKRKEADDAQAESATRTARGLAWRKNKRRERLLQRVQERKQLRQSALTAGMTAAGLQGGGLAGAGRAAGGTLGGMAGAALGPVGAIVGQAVGGAVGDAVGSAVSALARPFELVGRAAQFTARALDKVASNDGIGTLDAAAQGAADVLEKIPIVGGVLADNLRGLSAVVTSAKSALDSFAARGRELSGFSGDIAAAGARQDVARLLGDIREAQRMGALYARTIDAQTRLEGALREGLMPIKEQVMVYLPIVLDKLVEYGFIGSKVLADFFGSDELKELVKKAKASYDAARAGGGPSTADPASLMAAWLMMPAGFGAPAAPAPIAPPGLAGAGLGIPLVTAP